MPEEIVMPRLSDSMEEGTILKWMKGVGDEVALGDELVEIETDKANMVFEADAAGTLIEIVAGEGDTLPIGEVIARVGEASEAPSGEADGEAEEGGGGDGASPPSGSPRVHAADSPPEDSAAPAASAEAPQKEETEAAAGAEEGEREQDAEPEAPDTPTQPASARDSGNGRVKASPLARRIAEEKGVDLGSLTGSGPGGRIIKADVEGAEAAPAEAAPAPSGPAPTGARERPETAKGKTETVELTKLQQTVSRRMAESKATAPHFYLQAEVDMSRAFAARARIKAGAGEDEVVPSFNDMVVKAAAIALGNFPRANGAYRDGRWELYERVNVGIAVAASEALVVPTIFDADKKGLVGIATEARALAARVRERTITPPELSGATFTVSNLGMYGVSNFHPVINAPQAAILAVGAIVEAPVVREGELAVARLMGVTLACDHRILYGADAAQFLARVRALLEEPLGLAL